MATVYVVTAGSGDTYRIERVYLDRDQAGLSREKVEELFWDTITQVRADLAGVPRK